MKIHPQTIPMMIVAECNYYHFNALYIFCCKAGLQILIKDYNKIIIKHYLIDTLVLTIKFVSAVALPFIRTFEKSEIMHRNLLI